MSIRNGSTDSPLLELAVQTNLCKKWRYRQTFVINGGTQTSLRNAGTDRLL